MERNKRIKGYYTVVRYIPDIFNGEIINIGLIIHLENGSLKYKFVDKESIKIKAFKENKANLYQSIKNKLEYYLNNTEGLVGLVGNISIASPENKDFLNIISKYFTNENLEFSKPKPMISKNSDLIFKNLYEKYINESDDKKVNENIKTEVTKLFEKRNYFGTKVRKNHKIKPIKDIDDVTMKIDFIYKNGVWNYIQVIPDLSSNKKKLDFLAEIKLLFSAIPKEDKVKFVYSGNNNEVKKLIKYLEEQRNNIEEINMVDNNHVKNLLLDIEQNAQNNVEELLAI
ncbi:DUF3037 domain-containing protein [Mammaliicoccus sciuri]|uniref:DUF3037 domain-containing protein n=1 Tax=Mammaliicoccus sciuri TaxID=1296 RepID=UPI0009924C9C|nr:DUF3037 domain-containing protein [Mammaliicoccus sciuri]OOV37475.1 hypothetical protein BS756_11190 [Staphylococcus sp. MB371]MBV5103496.1 DUF3037 domain-containing protein [Mammaliicoccus sciuri]MEB5791181.1 DUF3037 domain-containing protein [Mammaliicoccus sciuri]MEB8263474.1 DUF3037 domain-containing protein [Mammaliicoccus sciuri]MRE71017.1 DUF3037 domain-containing protein [Mammaliicoccus sciuri]